MVDGKGELRIGVVVIMACIFAVWVLVCAMHVDKAETRQSNTFYPAGYTNE